MHIDYAVIACSPADYALHGHVDVFEREDFSFRSFTLSTFSPTIYAWVQALSRDSASTNGERARLSAAIQVRTARTVVTACERELP
jgi:hypothetical protein